MYRAGRYRKKVRPAAVFIPTMHTVRFLPRNPPRTTTACLYNYAAKTDNANTTPKTPILTALLPPALLHPGVTLPVVPFIARTHVSFAAVWFPYTGPGAKLPDATITGQAKLPVSLYAVAFPLSCRRPP